MFHPFTTRKNTTNSANSVNKIETFFYTFHVDLGRNPACNVRWLSSRWICQNVKAQSEVNIVQGFLVGAQTLFNFFQGEYIFIYTIKWKGYIISNQTLISRICRRGNFQNRHSAPAKNNKIIVLKTMPLEKRKILYFIFVHFFYF